MNGNKEEREEVGGKKKQSLHQGVRNKNTIKDITNKNIMILLLCRRAPHDNFRL